MELPFGGQITANLDLKTVGGMLRRLSDKLNIGQLLTLKAEAQGLVLQETAEADEVYDTTWARNTAAVTQLLVD